MERMGLDDGMLSTVKAIGAVSRLDSRHVTNSIVLLGPSGVGKTELARRIASSLHNLPVGEMEERGLFVQIDMTAYQDRESIQAFTGSAPGYHGESPMRKVTMAALFLIVATLGF